MDESSVSVLSRWSAKVDSADMRRALREHSVARFQWSSLAVLCVLAVCADPAHGCRYNVREIGFIDVGVEPYRLFVYLPSNVPSSEADNLKNTLDAAFADTNIRCEPIPAGMDANHPASRALSEHGIDQYPAVVLVSPDGPSRRLALDAGGRSLVEAVSLALEAMLDSPTRRQILEKAADRYGVVLLIEGPQQDRNAAARETVSAAISYVDQELESLPKPIARGPEMVVLDRPSQAREELLLWVLGLKPEDVNEPCAAVFYGRGRWIGPLFKGGLLSDANLLRILPIIGADCECGLDHRWLQGTMLPARWNQSLQQKVAANLGFDPESPLVKMEMVSIVRRGMGGSGAGGVPFGYREIEVGDTSQDSTTGSDQAPPVNEPVMVSPQPVAVQANVEVTGKAGKWHVLAMSLGAMIVLVAVGSVIVLLKARRA
jgi:hypothetical protein